MSTQSKNFIVKEDLFLYINGFEEYSVSNYNFAGLSWAKNRQKL